MAAAGQVRLVYEDGAPGPWEKVQFELDASGNDIRPVSDVYLEPSRAGLLRGVEVRLGKNRWLIDAATRVKRRTRSVKADLSIDFNAVKVADV